jgi:hypothetical protein
MTIKTHEEAEQTHEELKKFYLKHIYIAAFKAGGMHKLSLEMEYHPLTLYKTLQRGSFTALRKLYLKIKESENG